MTLRILPAACAVFLAAGSALAQTGATAPADPNNPVPIADAALKKVPRDSAPAPYADRLIDEALAGEDDGISLDDRERGPQPDGRRQVSVEIRHHTRSSGTASTATEDGAILQYRRETAALGEFDVQAQGRRTRDPGLSGLAGPGTGRAGDLTVQQFGFALSTTQLMDNGAGALRVAPDPLLGRSFRINLPGWVMEGAQSRVYTKDSDTRVFAGNLGGLYGLSLPTFFANSGRISGASHSNRLSAEWSAGAAWLNVRDAPTVTDHSNLLWTLRYEPLDNTRRVELRGLSDSLGHHSAWLDTMERIGRWEYRYGGFYLPKDLAWISQAIITDQQGVYARLEYRGVASQAAFGGDVTETNILRDQAAPGTYTNTVYANGSYRLSRSTSLNGSVTLIDRQAKTSWIAADSSRTETLALGIQERFDWGTAQFRTIAAKTDRPGASDRSRSFIWDQSWPGLRAADLSTSVSRTQDSRSGLDTATTGATALLRAQLASRLSLEGGFGVNRIDVASTGPANGRTANAALVWNLDRNWSGRAQMTLNRVDVSDPNQPFITQDRTLLLTLRYADASGLPYMAQGTTTGRFGNGRIVGWVFLDENNDGTRQASERGVHSVLVSLDGRYTATTDEQGRFEFNLVPSGPHRITISVDQVPLPWGLADERPRTAEVPVRDTVIVDIPLTRISQ